jgi:hypothetical protein
MNILKKLIPGVLLSFILLGVLTTSGCLKGEFDAPPIQGSDPNISEDQIVSLTEVMAKFVSGKYTPIALDKYLKAVIVADDRSGNFYKTLILEDDNSDLGIALLIDETELHAQYAVGRRVYVHLKDLTISDYNGLPQIGMGIDNSGTSPRLGYIPSSLLTKVLQKGQFNIPVVPRVKKISELNSQDLNTLVKLEGVEFASTGVTYANISDPTNPQTVNQTIKDCFGGQIILRNSGYADFAGQTVPEKNGALTAVYSIFRTDKQLFIRETTDVAFDKTRCDGGGTGGGDLITITSVRTSFTSGATTAPTGFVRGVVISDAASKNVSANNLIVQDASGGIILRFKTAISVPLGSEVKVNVGGFPFEEFGSPNGVLQIKDIPNTNVEVLGNGTITPKVITISQADPNTIESTLVKIVDAELTGDTKYSTTLKIKDASGETILFTIAGSSPATFSGKPITTGKVTVTAIVSEFKGTRQLTIRNLNDVVGDGSGCDTGNATLDCDGDGVLNGQDCAPNDANVYPGKPCDDGNSTTTGDAYNAQCQCVGQGGSGLNENFSSLTKNVDIALVGWDNVATKGTRKWIGNTFQSTVFAQASAYLDTNPETETWLVTPEVTTSIAGTLTFESAYQVWRHDGMTVWVTTNYTGNPGTTVWTQINCRLAVKTDAEFAWIPSGNIDLKQYGEKVRIAFKYVGDKTANTTSYRIDNVMVK